MVRKSTNGSILNYAVQNLIEYLVNPAIFERNSRDALNLKELRAINRTPPNTFWSPPARDTPTKGIPMQIPNRKSSMATSGGSSGYYSNYTPPGGQVMRKTSIVPRY